MPSRKQISKLTLHIGHLTEDAYPKIDGTPWVLHNVLFNPYSARSPCLAVFYYTNHRPLIANRHNQNY